MKFLKSLVKDLLFLIADVFRYMCMCFFTDEQVQKRYVKAGAFFGDALSCSYLGEPAGVQSLLSRWAKWEREYVRRGYKTLSLDVFISYGGYGTPLEGLGTLRNDKEPAAYHAEIYRQKYLGKINPAVDMSKLMAGECQKGEYVPPSTEETVKEGKQ
jgi:hypothetical protein